MNDHVTIASGSPIGPARWPDRSVRLRRGAAAGRAAACGERLRTTPSGAQPDRLALLLAYSEMPSLLREAARAAEAAASQARLLAALVDDVLAGMTGHEPAPDDGAFANRAPRLGMPPLTPREREVLALVAEGRTNKAIAEALFVSPNTVKTHVASLLHKLRATSRAHLAAIATRVAADQATASIA